MHRRRVVQKNKSAETAKERIYSFEKDTEKIASLTLITSLSKEIKTLKEIILSYIVQISKIVSTVGR